MEIFNLLSMTWEQATCTLSVLVRPTAFHEISNGSDEFIVEVLKSIGLSKRDAQFKSWTINHFITNYLAYHLDSQDWRDVWRHAWEIRIQLQREIAFERHFYEICSLWTIDETWNGKKSPVAGSCVIIADFYKKQHFNQALRLLKNIEQQKEASESSDLVPIPDQALLDEFLEAYNSITPQSLSVQQRPGSACQFLIELGRFDQEFFMNGAPLASTAIKLVSSLNGTTSWDDRTSPEHIRIHCQE